MSLGLIGPRSLRVAKPLPPAVVRAAPVRAAPVRSMPSVAAKQSSTAYYNPSRIIDRSRLKIVDSIAAERQKDFAEERGDTVVPINGSGGGTAAARPIIDAGIEKSSKPINITQLVGVAIAAYFLFGG